MDNEQRDKLLIELHQDVKWIKAWIAEQKQYKLLIWGALITALIGLIK